MSAQTKGVDVLAVIRRDAVHADAYRITHGVLDATPQQLVRESNEAHAAVAELIEADKAYDHARAIYDNKFRECTKAQAASGLRDARARRAAALARCGGA